MVDESFVDFSEDYASDSLLCDETLETHPELVVMKSISKSYGVPGLRLGVAASADARLIAWMKKDVPIWNINLRRILHADIREVRSGLPACVCEVPDGKGPFLFGPEERAVSAGRSFAGQLFPVRGARRPYRSRTDAGIARPVSHFNQGLHFEKGFTDGRQYVRIAVRNRTDNERLIEALNGIETHGL